jgi:hypothetical protein
VHAAERRAEPGLSPGEHLVGVGRRIPAVEQPELVGKPVEALTDRTVRPAYGGKGSWHPGTGR